MKATYAGEFLFGLVIGSSVLLGAQQSHPAKRTFTSPDGTFHFQYTASLVSCRRDQIQADRWKPEKSCEAYTPVCSDFGGNSTTTIACIAYPARKMKGTNFQAAAFSVNELKESRDEAECLKMQGPPFSVGKAHTEAVNGIRFTVTETDGVATGNLIEGQAYRSFHGDKCYELDIRIAFSNAADYEPATKSFDINTVRRDLKRTLCTFQFTQYVNDVFVSEIGR
jgi:hypothetical protein